MSVDRKFPLVAIFALALLSACGSSEDEEEDVAVSATYTSINAAIVQAKCVSCHAPGGSKSDVDLSTYAALTNAAKTYVTAGVPDSSSFYTQIKNKTMPKGTTKLSANVAAAISTWITAGAPND